MVQQSDRPMMLPIEQWLDSNEIPSEARVAFSEAIVCFKASAYRSALLFSYVGWSLSIRRRVLAAERPESIPEKMWEQIAGNLLDDDKWDAQAFDSTQQKSPRQIFPISDDLRTQVRFWKDRRNDCAHFKTNEIGSAHVEAFWAFLQSNLAKFVTIGSEADLLLALERHYDSSYTPLGSDVDPVVMRIPTSVEPNRFPGFLDAVVESFSLTVGDSTYYRPELAEIFVSVLGLSQDSLSEAVVEICESRPPLLAEVLRAKPGLCLCWATKPQLVRKLWREILFEGNRNDLRVYAAFLRNGLIPDAETSESNLAVATRLRGDHPHSEDVGILASYGFFAAFREVAFEHGKIDKFNWGNPNKDTIRWYLANHPLDEEIVGRVCSVFASDPFPFGVQAALQEMFVSLPGKRAEFESISAAIGREFPLSLEAAAEEEV